MDEHVVDILQSIGLSEYQSRAYVTAVGLGSTTLSSLSDEADIPQQRIYDVVDDLEERGLVEVHEGKNGKEAVAVPPTVGLAEHKRQRIDVFESSVDDAMDELSKRFDERNTSAGFVTVLNHRSSVRRHVRTAIESAEWWLFCSLSVEWYQDVQEEIQAALERGVTVRLLVQADDPATVENSLYPDGLLVRYRPSADLVVAADREYGIFRGVSSESVARPSLVSRDESMVEMFQRYSEQFWTGSMRVRTERPYPRRYLAPWRVIGDHVDLLDAGERPLVTVEGHDTETGRVGTWEGVVVDYEFESEYEADFSVVLPEVARLVVETGGERLTVGGWDATLEDVAAHGIEVRPPE